MREVIASQTHLMFQMTSIPVGLLQGNSKTIYSGIIRLRVLAWVRERSWSEQCCKVVRGSLRATLNLHPPPRHIGWHYYTKRCNFNSSSCSKFMAECRRQLTQALLTILQLKPKYIRFHLCPPPIFIMHRCMNPICDRLMVNLLHILLVITRTSIFRTRSELTLKRHHRNYLAPPFRTMMCSDGNLGHSQLTVSPVLSNMKGAQHIHNCLWYVD